MEQLAQTGDCVAPIRAVLSDLRPSPEFNRGSILAPAPLRLLKGMLGGRAAARREVFGVQIGADGFDLVQLGGIQRRRGNGGNAWVLALLLGTVARCIVAWCSKGTVFCGFRPCRRLMVNQAGGGSAALGEATPRPPFCRRALPLCPSRSPEPALRKSADRSAPSTLQAMAPADRGWPKISAQIWVRVRGRNDHSSSAARIASGGRGVRVAALLQGEFSAGSGVDSAKLNRGAVDVKRA